jgi:hypothetical protein
LSGLTRENEGKGGADSRITFMTFLERVTDHALRIRKSIREAQKVIKKAEKVGSNIQN